jgi:predicted small metal-binding protein
MIQRIAATVLVVLLSFVFATSTFAQDAQKEMKKEHKMGQKMEKKAEEKSTALKSVSCPAPCNFMCRSHDEKELTAIIKTHVKKVHKTDMTDKQISEMMKTEDVK